MNHLIHCLYGTVLVNIHSYLHFMLTVCTVHIKVYCMVQFFCYETTSQQKYAHAHNMLFNSKCTQLLVILFMVWYVYYALKLFHDVRVNTCPAALSWVRKTPIVRSKKESIKKEVLGRCSQLVSLSKADFLYLRSRSHFHLFLLVSSHHCMNISKLVCCYACIS